MGFEGLVLSGGFGRCDGGMGGLTFDGSGREGVIEVVGWDRSSWGLGGRRGGVDAWLDGGLNDFFWRRCSFLTGDVEVSFGGSISGVEYMAGRTVTWKEVRKRLGDTE